MKKLNIQKHKNYMGYPTLYSITYPYGNCYVEYCMRYTTIAKDYNISSGALIDLMMQQGGFNIDGILYFKKYSQIKNVINTLEIMKTLTE